MTHWAPAQLKALIISGERPWRNLTQRASDFFPVLNGSANHRAGTTEEPLVNVFHLIFAKRLEPAIKERHAQSRSCLTLNDQALEGVG
jgi:hypothetical protein